MLKYLYGEAINITKKEFEINNNQELDLSLFNENSVFKDGYCMEFLLQLMRDTKYSQRFILENFVNDLKSVGESIVAVQDERRVKIHIHTLKPGRVIALAQEYGEFLTFKLENMQLQHNEVIENKRLDKKHKPLAIITVCNGDGIKKALLELGSDIVINGGEKMNASANDFIEAFKQVNADKIVVLPNNSNLFGVVRQAQSLSEMDNIELIETTNMVEAYLALSMDVQDNSDIDYRMSQMKQGLQGTNTIMVSKAIKDYAYEDVEVKTGEYAGILNNEVILSQKDISQAFIKTLDKVEKIEDKETMVIFKGLGVTNDLANSLKEEIEKKYEDLEVMILEGNQFVYDFIAGIF